MSKLEELIQKLCPNGVEYRKIKDICEDVIVPMRDRPKIFNGNIPWCRIEDKEGQYFNKSLSGLGVSDDVIKKMNLKIFPTGTVICSCSASLGAYAINTQPLITNQTFIGLVCGEKIYNKFLLYYMETQTAYLKSQASTGTIPYISRKKFEELQIPLPPLEIQQEIVRILDKFTELTAELKSNLEAELTARKKQYEYYTEKLLDFDDSVEWNTMGNIATVSDYVANGSFASLKENVIYKHNPDFAVLLRTVDYSNGFDSNKFIYIDEHAYNYLEKSKLFGGEIIINNIGAGVGTTFRCPNLELPMSLAPNAIMVKTPNDAFYYYWFKSKYGQDAISKITSKSAMPKFNKTGFKTIKVPIPPLAEQERIVSILDRFDALCNDISSGLPAEIEARQKQYEFYRDKLLTF